MSELSDTEKLALGDEAKRLLDSALFNGLVSSILKEQLSVFTAEELHSPKSDTAHATIRALDDIKKSLRVLSNDAAVIRKRLDKR